MSNKQSFLFFAIVNIIAVVLIGIIYYFLVINQGKTAYVDLNKALTEFEMQKELSEKLDKIKNLKQMHLDSLELELKILSKRIIAQNNSDKDIIASFEAKRESFIERSNKYQQENEDLANTYNQQIFKQLSQYIKDYGSKNDFKYIFGADGSGSLMYAKENEDVTSETIVYINERYKGKEK